MTKQITSSIKTFDKPLEYVVIFIILFIVFLLTINSITSHGFFSEQKPRFKISQIRLSKLDWSIKEYRQDTGSYPINLSQLVSNSSDSWMGPYIKEKELKDPWGHSYQYLFISEPIGYFLFTLGEDNAVGGNKADYDLTSEMSLPLLRFDD